MFTKSKASEIEHRLTVIEQKVEYLMQHIPGPRGPQGATGRDGLQGNRGAAGKDGASGWAEWVCQLPEMVHPENAVPLDGMKQSEM